MVAAMHHRGPDDSGTYFDSKISLGMRRLAVIDVNPTGHQPMSNREQTVWIVFNGEIYNYREERAQLENGGIKFSSTSDTEVLLRLYENYGDDFLLRLRGMFALAIYDKRKGAGRERLFIARDQLALGAAGFGILSASFGIGAVGGALLLPRGLQRTSLQTMVTSCVLLWIVGALLVASAGYTAVAIIGAGATGAAWTGVLSSLSAGTQTAAPAWVRARSVSMNLIAVQVSMALGSALWGWLASLAGTPIALTAAAGTMLLLLAVNRRVKLRMGDEADVTPGVQLPDLAIAVEPLPDDGPVLIQIEYRIERQNVDQFMRAIAKVEAIRRRNGASDWLVFRDLGEDGRFVERFIIRSWAEYVRLRTRMTMADREKQDRVEGLQHPDVPVRVSRLIAT